MVWSGCHTGIVAAGRAAPVRIFDASNLTTLRTAAGTPVTAPGDPVTKWSTSLGDRAFAGSGIADATYVLHGADQMPGVFSPRGNLLVSDLTAQDVWNGTLGIVMDCAAATTQNLQYPNLILTGVAVWTLPQPRVRRLAVPMASQIFWLLPECTACVIGVKCN